jgi:hypothetical protein
MPSLPLVSPSRRIAVSLEVGPKRSFAIALDWPGWCRSGRSEEEALETLAAYAGRYARVARRAALSIPGVTATDLEIAESVPGTAVTDFGAPDVVTDADRGPLTGAAARRTVALLDACWEELDAVLAKAPPTLRKGPRGGGRDPDAMFEHVVGAERGYARHVGIGLNAREWREGRLPLLRERIREAVLHPDEAARATRPWPARYLARRLAWHALDHAWEIEDRS